MKLNKICTIKLKIHPLPVASEIVVATISETALNSQKKQQDEAEHQNQAHFHVNCLFRYDLFLVWWKQVDSLSKRKDKKD